MPQQLDPMTLQMILQNLPEIQKRQSRAKQLRGVAGQFNQLSQQPGTGNYEPRQAGAWFPTVQRRHKDYAQIGNQIAGSLGEFFSNRAATKAEREAGDMTNEQILRTVEQIGQGRKPGAVQGEGAPTEATLRAYLGLLGGPEVQDLLGKQAHVSSTRVDDNGNIVLIMSDGRQVETGRKADYGTQIITGQDGQQIAIGKSGAGRGVAQDVRYGGGESGNPLVPGGSADMGFGTAAGTPPMPARVQVDFLSPEQNQMLSQLIGTMPPAQADQFMAQFAGGVRTAQSGGAGPAAGAPVRVPTKAEEAASTEAAKIQTQLAYAGQTAQAAAAEKGLATTAEAQAKLRMELPKMQSSRNLVNQSAKQLLEHKGLDQIVGGMGGRIPDGPAAMKYFNFVMAGTPAADAMALHNQVKGEVFLQAYNTLKGGGQITEIEGQKAEQAMARMDRAQSKEAYRKAVQEFVDAVNAGYQKLEAAAMASPAASAGPPAQPSPAAGPSIDDLLKKYGGQ